MLNKRNGIVCIVSIYSNNGYITDDISDMFGVSLRSIQRWQSNFNQYGSGGALITQ